MKIAIILSLIIFVSNFQSFGQVQPNDDAIKESIRNLELAEIRAIVERDVDVLSKIWSEDFMVNNPLNHVIHGNHEVLDRVRSGFINYSLFERDIESMMVLDGVVIVMGQEKIMPVGNAYRAGETLYRRYTNIWTLDGDEWRVKARHANIICGN